MRIGIVGCSINGAYLAYKLAKEGHNVTVFEEKSEIGGKSCSGLVSKRLWDFIPRNDELVENGISTAEIRFPKKKVTVEFSHEMLAVNRNALDKYAAALAEKAGVKILAGHKAIRIISIGRSKPHLVAENGGHTIVREFDRIIGCDGANSFVREHLRATKPSFRMGVYAAIKRKGKKNAVEIGPTRYGFKWKIPRGKTTEVGALGRPEDVKGMLNRGKKLGMSAAIIPEGLVMSKDKRFALCGDAAGLTKPWSGGGIIWGMTAADFLVKSKLNVAKYNRLLERHFGPKILFSKIARRAVYMVGTKARWLLPKLAYMDSDWLY